MNCYSPPHQHQESNLHAQVRTEVNKHSNRSGRPYFAPSQIERQNLRAKQSQYNSGIIATYFGYEQLKEQ